ncbi:Lateral signaling target protein 2 homolog [Gryllus bimaculatus]|nr:Lateral signaling target protein 2 homolog [Gryllus bimaculatus]
MSLYERMRGSREEDMSSELNVQALTEELVPDVGSEEIAQQSTVDQDTSVRADGTNSSIVVEDNVQDLQEKLQQALSRKATLETRVVRLMQSNVTLKATVDDMDRELNQLRERHKILEAQLAHRESIDDAAVLRQDYKKMNCSLQATPEEKSESSAESEQNQKLINQLNIKSGEVNRLTKIHGEIRSELSRKDEDLTKMRREIEEAKQNMNAYSKTMDKQQKELHEMLSEEKKINTNLTKELKKISEEKSDIEKKWLNCQRDYVAAQNTVTDLQQSLTELQHEYQNVQSEHEQQRQQLRSTIQEKSDLLQKQEDAVQILVSERAELTRQLELVEAKKQQEMDKASQKMEKLQNELQEKKEIQKDLEACLLSANQKSHSLEEKINKLKESSNAAIEAKNDELKGLRSSLDETTGEKLALEAQLEATGSEHQKLLERCYASTSEIETLQHTVSELRRKWEESESALQELGRENATLQLDIEKLLARKWAEDADVTKCTLCHREFTMLLRKHHCRNCGQIFCNECSSKTAAVVSNKKPVRVCDSCYTELRTN